MDDERYQPEIETTLSHEFENTVKNTTRSRSWLYRLAPLRLVYLH